MMGVDYTYNDGGLLGTNSGQFLQEPDFLGR